MAEENITGTAQRLGGRVQEAVGHMTGDTRTQVEGAARRAYGSAQHAYGTIRDNAEQGVEMLTEQVRAYPMGALLLAGALGYLLGRLSD